MKVVYISGPMTGVKKYNYPLFNKVAKKLRTEGFTVINPAEFFEGTGKATREQYMRESIKAVLEVDKVVLLPDWDKSQGALLEVLVAKELGLEIVEYNS